MDTDSLGSSLIFTFISFVISDKSLNSSMPWVLVEIIVLTSHDYSEDLEELLELLCMKL